MTFPIFDVTRYSGYRYYINIVSNYSHLPAMLYNDVEPVADWEMLSEGDMCVSRAEVAPGTHSVGHPDPDATLYVTVYGQGYAHTFSYPAGFNLILSE